MSGAHQILALARHSWLETGRRPGWWLLVLLLPFLSGLVGAALLAEFPAGRGFTVDNTVTLLRSIVDVNIIIAPAIAAIVGLRIVRSAQEDFDRLIGSMNIGAGRQLLGHALAAALLLLPMLILPVVWMSILLIVLPDLTPISWTRQGIGPSELVTVLTLGLLFPAFQIGSVAIFTACRFRSTLAVNAVWIGCWVLNTAIGTLPRDLPDGVSWILAVVAPTREVWFERLLLSPNLGSGVYRTMGITDMLAFRSGALAMNLLLWFAISLLCLFLARRSLSQRLRARHVIGSSVMSAALSATSPLGPGSSSTTGPSLERTRASSMKDSRGPLPWYAIGTIVRSTGFWIWQFVTGFIVMGFFVSDAGSASESVMLPSSDSLVRRFGVLMALLAMTSAAWSFGYMQNRTNIRGMSEIILRSGVRTNRLALGPIVTPAIISLAIPVSAWIGLSLAAIVGSTLQDGSARLDLLWPTPVVWYSAVIILPGALLTTSVLMFGLISGPRRIGSLVAFFVLLLPAVAVWTPWSPGWFGDWMLAGLPWSASAPFEYDRFGITTNRILVLATAVLATSLSISCYPRQSPDPTAGPPLGRRLRQGLLRPTAILSSITIATCVSLLVYGVASGRESTALQRRYDAYSQWNLATWYGELQPRVTSIRFRCDLHPTDRLAHFDVTMRVRNDHEETLPSFAFTVSPTFQDVSVDVRRIDRESPRLGHFWSTYAHMLKEVVDPLGIEPGAQYELRLTYRLPAPAGLGWEIGSYGMPFVLPGGSLLSVIPEDASVLPAMGFLIDMNPKQSFQPRDPRSNDSEPLPAMSSGIDDLIDLEATITAPSGYRVNLPGRLLSQRDDGERTTFHWKTDTPIHPLFHIVGGPLESVTGEHGEVWFSPAHSDAATSILAALDAAIPAYSKWFGPIEHEYVRITEFPGYTSYSQSGDGNIVMNEFAGFHQIAGPEHDLAFSTAAHEIAHQWWGLKLIPALGEGGNVLSEGLAEYATIRLIEEARGSSAVHAYLDALERDYLEGRDPTDETPLALVEHADHGSAAIQYHRGGWMFWMVANLIGFERHDAALRKMMLDFSRTDDHATMSDYYDVVIEYALDKNRAQAFLNDWLWGTEVGLLSQELQSCVPMPEAPDRWRTRILVRYLADHPVPVSVALRGAVDTETDGAPEEIRNISDWPPDRAVMLEFQTDFQPTTSVIDPDRRVLLLDRPGTTLEIRP